MKYKEIPRLPTLDELVDISFRRCWKASGENKEEARRNLEAFLFSKDIFLYPVPGNEEIFYSGIIKKFFSTRRIYNVVYYMKQKDGRYTAHLSIL